MDEFDDALVRAGEALDRLASGPGQAAADALEAAFARAGARIEESLAEAARSGELDFRRMAEAILADLLRLAAQSAFGSGQVGAGATAPTLNLTVAGGSGGDAARSVLASQGAISAALARAVAAGGRFL